MTFRGRLSRLIGKHFGGDRDLYATMGYPDVIDDEEYYQAYQRQDIASRIIDAYPDATWAEKPIIKGDKDFAASFESLLNKINVFQEMHRLDRLMNMGRYGVLVLGLDGGEPFDQPATGSNYKLMYLQPHSERTAKVSKWDDNPNSARYGKPVLYNITSGVNSEGVGGGQRALSVHWTRVIHVAERALEDDAIGQPRLQAVWNRLMDLDKLLGSSSEIYWLNAAMTLAFIADSDVDWEPEESAAIKEQLDEMQDGLRRFLRLRGVTPQQLAPATSGDPSNSIDKLLDIISGTIGIPKRILTGSERGELASSQDESNWAKRNKERREQLIGPSFIGQFIEAGLRLGFLSGTFSKCYWDEGDSLSEDTRAAVNLQKAQALAAYTNAIGADLIVTPNEIRKMIGFEEEIDLPEIDDLDEGDDDVADAFDGNVA